jgi:hypothetical protein
LHSLVDASQVRFTALASDVAAGTGVKAALLLTSLFVSRTCVRNGGQDAGEFGSAIRGETAGAVRDVGRGRFGVAEAGDDSDIESGVSGEY